MFTLRYRDKLNRNLLRTEQNVYIEVSKDTTYPGSR